MRNPPAALAEFVRDPGRHFAYMTRDEIDTVMCEVRDLREHVGGQ